MANSIFVVPQTQSNWLKLPALAQSCPQIGAQWRGFVLSKKDYSIKFGNINYATTNGWGFSVAPDEIEAFGNVGFEGIEVYTSTQELLEVYNMLFDNSI